MSDEIYLQHNNVLVKFATMSERFSRLYIKTGGFELPLGTIFFSLEGDVF